MTHYDSKAVWEAASEKDEVGYRLAVIELKEGDTAWNPASTKPGSDVHGPTTVRYLLHPSGVNFTIDSHLATLHKLWRAALENKETNPSDAADAEEQHTYDRLIDYIEENDLNGTADDPRVVKEEK